MKRLYSATCTAILCAGILLGQANNGNVVGTVTDPDGSVVPNAEVAVVNDGTKLTRTTTTNSQGQFTVTFFPTGNLTVTVAQPGFQKLVRGGIQLTAADTITLNLQLSVGDVRQVVEVTGTAPLLEAQTAAVSNLVENHQVEGLPLNGRSFTSLVLLAPGVVPEGNTTGGGSYNLRAGTGFSVNGSQAGNNAYLIDGLVDAGLWLNSLVMLPTIDSVQEVRQLTSNYSAEFGTAAGMVTVVQTKSGSNAFHGGAYEFVQNAVFNANNYFNNATGIARTGTRRNEFGGTVGGPIRRDKTFFFADYQGLRIGTPTSSTQLIPTPAQVKMMQTGNFSALGTPIFDPLRTTVGANGQTQRVPFDGNIIPANRLDPITTRLAGWIPAPNVVGVSGVNYAIAPQGMQNTNQFDAKVDQNVRASDHIFVKYSSDRSEQQTPATWPTPANVGVPIGPYTNGGTAQLLKNWSLTTNYVWIMSPATVNELRVGALRWNHDLTPLNTAFNTAAAIGLPGININPFAGGLPGLTVTATSGGFSIGDGGTFPETNRELTYQVEDIITRVHGTHTTKFGGRFLRYHLNGYSAYPVRGTFAFNGQFTSQLGASSTSATGLADWALGAVNNMSRNVLNGTFGMRFWDLAGFVDDSWRVANKLTLNLGLRYEIQAPPIEVADRWANLNITTGQMLVANVAGHSRALRSLDTNDFQPRVGFAFSMNPRTVVRAGFGSAYVEDFNMGAQLYKNPPYFLSQSYVADKAAAPGLFLQNGLTPPVPVPVINGIAQLTPGTVSWSWDQHLKTPKILQWSFGIQRQITQSVSVETAYVGSRSIDALQAANLNQAFPGSAPVDTRRPLYLLNPNVGNLTYWTNLGDSVYHSGQLKITKRVSRGFSIGGSYTYAHNIGNIVPTQGGQNLANAYCWGSCERSHQPEDRREVLVINHVYQLPFGPGRSYFSHGVISHLIGGWDVTGVWTVQSGNHLNVLLSSNTSNTGGSATRERPNLVGIPNLPMDQRTVTRWFNTAAFAQPAAGTFGNAAPYLVVSPGMFNLDASLHRTFKFSEVWGGELRAETFNTLNHTNWGNPNTTFGNVNFGKITSAGASRSMQLAFKLRF